jgi:hypothetical protein
MVPGASFLTQESQRYLQFKTHCQLPPGIGYQRSFGRATVEVGTPRTRATGTNCGINDHLVTCDHLPKQFPICCNDCTNLHFRFALPERTTQICALTCCAQRNNALPGMLNAFHI